MRTLLFQPQHHIEGAIWLLFPARTFIIEDSSTDALFTMTQWHQPQSPRGHLGNLLQASARQRPSSAIRRSYHAPPLPPTLSHDDRHMSIRVGQPRHQRHQPQCHEASAGGVSMSSSSLAWRCRKHHMKVPNTICREATRWNRVQAPYTLRRTIPRCIPPPWPARDEGLISPCSWRLTVPAVPLVACRR
jgi:hypothetical protein